MTYAGVVLLGRFAIARLRQHHLKSGRRTLLVSNQVIHAFIRSQSLSQAKDAMEKGGGKKAAERSR
jgi:hypothetical protein